MRITNATPLLVGPFASRHVRTNAPAMTVALKASFRLEHGKPPVPLKEPLPFLSDVYRDDDPAGECLVATDFAWWKPQADLLLTGTCHVPGGTPLGVCPVRFAVGGWSRTLLAFGARGWNAGAAAPEVAEPFTKLALNWMESFGGPGFADNPVGRGFGGELLPRLEDERQPTRRRGDTPPPASFGPVNRSWPVRRKKTGSYGGDYLKSRWPGLPTDFDWSYFNAAPEEQQVPWLKGDETLVLQNLHPELPLVHLPLPHWRPRCLARQVEGGLGRGERNVVLKELPLALDTLTVDMDEATLSLVWRGQIEVADEELEDVLELFVMVEDLNQPPAPAESLERFMTPPGPLLAAAVAGLLPRGGAAPGGTAPPGATAPPASTATPGATAASASTATPGATAAPPATAAPGAPAPPPPNSMQAAIDDLFKQHGKELNEAWEQARAGIDRLEAEVSDDPSLAPWPGFPDTPPPPDFAVRTHARLVEQYQAIADAGQLPSRELEQLVNKKGVFQSLDAARRAAATVPAQPPAAPPPLDAAAVRDRLARGESLARASLGGADLAGANLSGADLRQAVLRGGRLAGAKLGGAQLGGAQLSGADLQSADLKGCDLTQADLTGADLSGADLRGAKLGWAHLTGARLKGARLDQADAAYARLDGADLTQTRWDGARLKGASLADVTLDDAVFAGADLSEARLEGATGARADFRGANLTKLQAGERLRLVGARFTEAMGPGSNWQAAALEGCDFAGAALPGASFEKAALAGCRFDGADLAGVRFRKADLTGASLAGADVLRGSLARANLSGADFRDANLYEAEFFEATLTDARFSGANVRKTTLEDA